MWWAGESVQTLACKVSSNICVTSPGVPAVKPCVSVICCQNFWKVFAQINFSLGFPGKGWFHWALSAEKPSLSPCVLGRVSCILTSAVLDGLGSVFVHSEGSGCTVLTQDMPCVCTVSQDVPKAQTYSPEVPAHSSPTLARSCQLPSALQMQTCCLLLSWCECAHRKQMGVSKFWHKNCTISLKSSHYKIFDVCRDFSLPFSSELFSFCNLLATTESTFSVNRSVASVSEQECSQKKHSDAYLLFTVINHRYDHPLGKNII